MLERERVRESVGKTLGENQNVGNIVRKNWRDQHDTTTFFFTKFPEVFREEDLWKIFQRWGKVWEVFISHRRNMLGDRFGFVRFKNVVNEKKMEQDLDRIIIGNTKMFVNIPKFKRAQNNMRSKAEGGVKKWVKGRNNNGKIGVENSKQEMSYANVLKGKVKTGVVGGKAKQGRQSQEEVWKGKSMKVTMEGKEWLQKCWVGRLNDLADFNKLQHVVIPEEYGDIKLRYIGDDQVLISGLIASKIKKMMEGKEVNFLSMFHSIQEWNPGIATGNRMAWIRCSGLPLHAWDQSSLTSIVAEVGTLVMIDENTTNMEMLEYARLLVHLSSPQPVVRNSSIKINEVIYSYRLIEENFTLINNCKCALWNYENSSLESSSIDSLPEFQEELEHHLCSNNHDLDHVHPITTADCTTVFGQQPEKLKEREKQNIEPAGHVPPVRNTKACEVTVNLSKVGEDVRKTQLEMQSKPTASLQKPKSYEEKDVDWVTKEHRESESYSQHRKNKAVLVEVESGGNRSEKIVVLESSNDTMEREEELCVTDTTTHVKSTNEDEIVHSTQLGQTPIGPHVRSTHEDEIVHSTQLGQTPIGPLISAKDNNMHEGTHIDMGHLTEKSACRVNEEGTYGLQSNEEQTETSRPEPTRERNEEEIETMQMEKDVGLKSQRGNAVIDKGSVNSQHDKCHTEAADSITQWSEKNSLSQEQSQSESVSKYNDIGVIRGPIKATRCLSSASTSNTKGQYYTRRNLKSVTPIASDSLTESCIKNCNRLFWINSEWKEAINMWKLGMNMGVSYRGNEDSIIGRMVDMERRDRAEADKVIKDQQKGASGGIE